MTDSEKLLLHLVRQCIEMAKDTMLTHEDFCQAVRAVFDTLGEPVLIVYCTLGAENRVFDVRPQRSETTSKLTRRLIELMEDHPQYEDWRETMNRAQTIRPGFWIGPQINLVSALASTTALTTGTNQLTRDDRRLLKSLRIVPEDMPITMARTNEKR